MDIVRLRTMTRKSKMDSSSSFKGKTVGDLIDGGNVSYLVWMYYHIGNVTFTDDVLEEIHIFSKHRIAKPGVDHEMKLKRQDDYIKDQARKGNFKPLGRAKHRKIQTAKDRLLNTERFVDAQCSKASLTWKNQGH